MTRVYGLRMEMCKYAVIDMDRATYLHSDFPGVHGSRWKSKKPFPRSAQAMCQSPEILTWVGRYLVRLRAYLGSVPFPGGLGGLEVEVEVEVWEVCWSGIAML